MSDNTTTTPPPETGDPAPPPEVVTPPVEVKAETPAPVEAIIDPPPEPETKVDETAVELAALRERLAAAEAAQAKTSAEAERLSADALSTALGQLGVLEKYRKYAPEGSDATTPAGRAALQAWAESHPELVQKAQAPAAAEIDERLKDRKKSVFGWTAKQISESLPGNRGVH